jgi:hypothetical protein
MSTNPLHQLVEATEILPVVWRKPRRPRTFVAMPQVRTTDPLLAAFDLLSRRGVGPRAWATPFRDDPIAFLLDSMSDAVTLLWGAEDSELAPTRWSATTGCVGKDEHSNRGAGNSRAVSQ